MNDLFDGQGAAPGGPVECLGQTFPSDAARREHFLGLLREKLQDPEFRKIEGFPIGTDADILAMSDPPYYTACPNPFLEAFVAHYGRPYDPEVPYRREPMTIDVSVGKTDPLYKAHGYHTKVPHLAIVPSILHYTEPGDLVLDGFAGSGMTGVAAQWCTVAPASCRREVESEWKKQRKEPPKWGPRRVILNDQSPAATFIAANYNLPFDVTAFAAAGQQLLKELEQELGWMYETLHVEPASSRLKQLTGFPNVGPASNVSPASNVGPASSRPSSSTDQASRLEASPTDTGSHKGIGTFTQRQRDLPHWQLPGSFYFLTFNTHERRILSPESRQVALDALRYFDGQRLLFIAAVVMPDHVHAIIKPLPVGQAPVGQASSLLLQEAAGNSGRLEACPTEKYWDLSDLMHSIKSFSANRINQIEGTKGSAVWQTETYDHIIRNDLDYGFTLQYIAYNPVIAGLTTAPDDYPWFAIGRLVEEAGWKPAPLGRIEYTVWSEVFACPECAGQIDFIAEALDAESKRVRDSFPCPYCGADLNKDRLERVLESRIDPATGEPWQRVKFRPALISYVAQGQRREKRPDAHDLEILERIDALPLPPQMPTVRFPIEAMYHGSRIAPKGFSNTHHFFLPRAGQALGALWSKAKAHPDARIRGMLVFFVEQAIWGMSVLARYAPTHFSQVNQYLTGVYYVASQHSECSPWYILDGKLARLIAAFSPVEQASSLFFKDKKGRLEACPTGISTGTATRLPLPENCIDYIFTDPPFGENIFYADLNFLVESWHRVFTDARPEAIIDRFKHKALPEYQHLMQRCFAEYHRVLKPGRWMTVVFSNSKAAVWNAIQVALQQAGFVVAEVTALDKVQGSYRQVTSATAMKQDLVISAYKPNGGLEERFSRNGATVDSAWDFVRAHLRQLPAVKVTQGDFQELVHNVERDPRRIKDRLDAWFIRHDAMVPLSSPEFIAELAARFEMVDGMAFLPEQRVAYEQARSRIPQSKQAELFISDERSAIDWLTQFLSKSPSTRSEILPDYMPQIGAAKKKGEIIPELGQLLDDSFLCYDGAGEVPSQIHSYLSTNHKDLRGLAKDHPALVAKAQDRWYVPDPNKAQDLEKKREKALLKEFATYQAHTGRRLKEFRLEVLRAGFKAAWAAKDYRAIVNIAVKIPEEALQEDEKLLLWYDQALTRMEQR